MANTEVLRVFSVENELKRYPDMKTEHLQILKDWIRKQPHLPPLDDDLLLMQFLRRCHFSIERAKVKVDNYLTFRTHFPELTTNRDINNADIQDILHNWQIVALPKRDLNGNMVLVLRLLSSEADKLRPDALLKFFVSLLECYVRENGTIPGYVVIMDANCCTLAQISTCTLSLCRQIYFYVQKCCPSSIKGVYSVNSSSIAEPTVKFFKSILPGKMVSQIHVIQKGALDNLYEYIPRDILPQEYGGEAGPMENLHRETSELLRRGSSYLASLDKLKVDKEKRRGEKLEFESVFGINGTFRKLEVD